MPETQALVVGEDDRIAMQVRIRPPDHASNGDLTCSQHEDGGTSQRDDKSGDPDKCTSFTFMSWRAALGLVLTIVWLYVELLRFISVLRE